MLHHITSSGICIIMICISDVFVFFFSISNLCDRSGTGPSGWRLSEVQSEPAPLTKMEMIANADQQAPDMVPRGILRLLMARFLAQQAMDWNKHAARSGRRT